MYKKVSTDMNFVEREKQVEKFWEDNQIFEKSMKVREGNPSYVFYDGPPTANGKPHIGHVETRVIKDMIPRYRTMKGYQVPRKAGWDTHGLPVELEVEKKLGLDGKDQIEKYGVEPFIEQCKESVWKYEGMWEDFSHTVGFWADMKNPYVTYHNDYIESEWWALKEIWKKGLLYEGHKIVPYCPRCGTPLSSHEVAQGYKDVKERSAVVRFKVKGEDAYILAWTTTPWTLPSNVALCVNPDEDYVKVTSKGYTYYMAAALVDTVLGEGAEVLEHYQGKDLEFKEYEPLFPYAEKRIGNKKAYYVVCDTYVTLTDGTGVVHIAPAFGEDDSKVGHRYDLPFVQLVNEKGEMTEETPWAGTFCKKADMAVLQALEDKDLLFDAPLFEHSYPHCWRCDTPLIYYARETWFIRMTAVKEDLIRNNNTINWIPESIGKGRFGDWLENVQDWGLSRNRYWGTPLPVWQCECGHQDCIGSIEELKEKADNCPDDIELHRPYIDAVTIKCPKCGKEMHRVPEVIDCWFDSGSMPFAQHHYPFENKETFEKQFPAQFISEAVDQTRGWFYSLLAISTLLFNKAPYENVIVLGLVQDENGQKMSKSKGNAVDPFDALQTYGADAIRWYFYINSAPWLPNRFHGKAVQEGQRKFMGTLWNTYAFFVLYANIDNFDATKYTLEYDKLPVMDKWLLSKMNSMVKAVDENDGDVTDSLVVESVSNFLGGGRRLVVYAAVDRHNNVSRANRIVQYEGYTSPKFYLKEPLCFESGGASKNEELLKNLTVKDKIDGDLSNQIKILTNSVVDLYTPGEYPVKLQVSNSAGDTVSFQATIQVYDATDRSEIPFIHLKKYLVYTKKGDKLDAASYISKVCMGGDYDSDVPGDINKSKVKIKDEVDYDTPGSYEITYSVKSGKSRTGTVRLIVIVTE